MKPHAPAVRIASAVSFSALLMLFAAGATVHAGEDKPRYEIAMLAVSGGSWDAIRYNVRTGEAWKIVDDKWVKLGDPKAIPESSYSIRMVALANDWGAIRFDQATGRTWKARDNAWVEIQE